MNELHEALGRIVLLATKIQSKKHSAGDTIPMELELSLVRAEQELMNLDEELDKHDLRN